MKSNELMIGNWLFNKNINKAMQVYPMMFSQMFRRTPEATTEDYGFYPIPLDARQLEKNGFRKTGPDGAPHLQSYVLAGDYEDVYAEEINDGTWKIDVDCTEFDLPRQTAMVSYLHQLQNWFRLCGIEKEIIAY